MPRLIAYNDLRLRVLVGRRPNGRPATVSGAGAPPIVVVGTTGDSGDALRLGEGTREGAESAVLVTHKGEGHTSFLVNNCVKKALDGYLLELKVPKDGLVCT